MTGAPLRPAPDPQPPTPDPHLVATVDLGGTKIRSLLVDASGQVLAADQRATEAERGQTTVIERILQSVRAVVLAAGARTEDLAGIGVAAPGPVDFHRGLVLEAPNLPGWEEVPLAAILAEQLGRPAFLENDANAAAVGEHRFGAGRGFQQMIYLTISTGIGGGLILDGQLYRGVDGTAGELGHVVVDPHGPFDDCGLPGCLEIMASGTAIARMGRQAADTAPDGSPLRRLAELAEITAREVHEAALAGDPTAAAILKRASESLAIGLANFINIFNPQLFVIGGGAANIWDDYVEPAFAAAQRLAFARPAATVRLRPAALEGDSGALGMAALTFEAVS